MTSGSKPPGSDSKTSEQGYGPPHIGKSGIHTFTDETRLAEDYSHQVPRQRLYEGAPWEHEVSVAWQKGGIWGVIVLVASYVLSCVSPPSLFNTKDSENIKYVVELITLHQKNKSFDDPEVQTILRKIFPDTSAIAREWADVQNKTPTDIREFLMRVEQRYREIENLDPGMSDFVEMAKEEILNHINSLRQQGAQKLVQAWQHKYEALKQFPIERDPAVLFKFYQSLETQLNELNAYNMSQIHSISKPLTEEIGELEELKKALKNEISSRLEKVQQTIEKRMPWESLHTTAKKEKIGLPKGNFGAQADHFQQKIQQKIRNSEQAVHQKAREVEELKTELVVLRKDKAECEEKQLLLVREKYTKIEAAQKASEKELTDNELKLSETILGRQLVVENLEATQRSLEAKKKSFWGISVVEGEQLLNTELRLKKTKEEIKNLKTQRNNLAQLPSTALQKTEIEIERDFTEKKASSIREMQRLENKIAQKSSMQEQTTSKWQEALANISRLKTVEDEFMRVWDVQLAGSEMQGDCKLFTRLTFLKGAFRGYQENPQADPVTWPQTYHAKTKDSFNAELLSSLKATGIREGSTVYQETQKTMSLVTLPVMSSPLVDRSGLEEFQ